MNKQLHLLLVAAIICRAIVVPVIAEEGPPADPPTPVNREADAQDQQDMNVGRSATVVRNPATGKIEYGPATPLRMRDLSVREQNMLSRSSTGLKERVLPNGTVALDLQGRFQSMAISSQDSTSAELKTSCSIDMANAEEAVHSESLE